MDRRQRRLGKFVSVTSMLLVIVINRLGLWIVVSGGWVSLSVSQACSWLLSSTDWACGSSSGWVSLSCQKHALGYFVIV